MYYQWSKPHGNSTKFKFLSAKDINNLGGYLSSDKITRYGNQIENLLINISMKQILMA